MGETEEVGVGGTIRIEASSAPLEYATPQELERAKQGVAEFKAIFAKSTLKQRLWLRYSDEAPMLQSMLLGLKPVAGFLGSDRSTRLEQLHLPERIHRIGTHLYDEEQVKEVIAKNPDVFDDFSGEVGTYLEDLISIRHGYYGTAAIADVKRIGLLYGFPKDAVIQYAQFRDLYHELFLLFRGHAGHILRNETGFTKKQKEIICQLGWVNSKGKTIDNPKVINDFRERHASEMRDFLTGMYPWLEEATVDYVVGNRSIAKHSFDFGTGKMTQETEKFLKKIEEVYDKSGMNAFLKSIRFLIHKNK